MRLLYPLILLLSACGGGGGGGNPRAAAQLGAPNPGLTQADLDSFFRGKAIFERRFGKSDGHGPHFNTSSCASCHEFPVTGGSAPLYRNFFLVGEDDGFTTKPVLEDDQLVLRLFSYTRPTRERIPNSANVVVQRGAPPMFGIGLFERISTNDILANVDPADTNPPDGVSGRVNLDGAFVGRFGFKAQEGNLEDFVRGPIFNHMGITSNPLSFGPGVAPQVSAPEEPTTDDDGVPDPELSFEELRDLVLYTRELAPPAPLPMDTTAQRGEQLFRQVGCNKCHIKNIVTAGPPVNAYTDLLLHDMGTALADGIHMGSASGSEFRTQPLWGLRHHAPYLHDGRAGTVREAILLHGGEAQQARDGFDALSDNDKNAILAFLETR